MLFNDKVIVITGAGCGIGADAARHLAKLGGKISLVDYDQRALDKVAEEIEKTGSPKPLKIVADVTNSAERIINETITHFGKIDVLINNAGVAGQDTIAAFSISGFDRLLDINLKSVVLLTSLAAPHLEKTKGNVINISSVASLRARKNNVSYSISKAALDCFTQCAALELADKSIRVNSVNPSSVRTTIIEKWGNLTSPTRGMSKEDAQKFYAEYGSHFPLGRVGEVADTSAAIAFLASDAASFITGISLPVDGGSLLSGPIHVKMN